MNIESDAPSAARRRHHRRLLRKQGGDVAHHDLARERVMVTPQAVALAMLGHTVRIEGLEALETHERDLLALRIHLVLNRAGRLALRARMADMPQDLAALAEQVAALEEASLRTATAAPAGWRPPAAADDLPVAEEWHVETVEEDGRFHDRLRAAWVIGHPRLGTQPYLCTTPLVWIDARQGFAQTASRLYRLGAPAAATPPRPDRPEPRQA